LGDWILNLKYNGFKKIITLEKIAFYIFFMSICVMCTYIFNYGVTAEFTSDSATANLLAQEQVLNSSFFPGNWYYAQDIWVFGINNYIILFDLFTDNLLLSRSFAVLTQSILILLFMYLLIVSFLGNRTMAFIFMAVICSGISSVFNDMFFGQAAYATVTLVILVSLYLSLLIVEDKVKSNKQMIIYMILLMITLTTLNMTGVRYIIFFTAPLIASIILYYLCENPTQPKVEKKAIMLILATTLSTIIGIIILYKVLMPNLLFVPGINATSFINADRLMSNIESYFLGILYLFEALPKDSIGLISIMGIVQTYRIILAVLIMFIIPVILFWQYKSLNPYMKLVLWFYTVGFASITYLYIFGSIAWNNDLGTARYFLISQFLAIFLTVYFVVRLASLFKYKYLLLFIIFIPLIFSSYLITMKTVFGYNGERHIVLKEHSKSGITDFLESSDLKYGYASYWNAGVISVLSSKSVVVSAINIAELKPFYWISSKRWYEPTTYAGDSFILLNDIESEVIDRQKLAAYLGDPKSTLRFSNYEVLVYNFNISAKLPGWPMLIGDTTEIYGQQLPSQIGFEYNNFKKVNEDSNYNGIFTYGPYIRLERGEYSIQLHYYSTGNNNQWDLGYPEDEAWRKISEGTLNESNTILDIPLIIDVSKEYSPIELRTFYTGKGDLIIEKIVVTKNK
jgi:hypothetical protein